MTTKAVSWLLFGALVGSVVFIGWKERHLKQVNQTTERSGSHSSLIADNQKNHLAGITVNSTQSISEQIDLPPPAPHSAASEKKSTGYPTDQIERNRLASARLFGRLLNQLNISSEQRDRVVSLLAERMAQAQDVRNIGEKQNLGRLVENRLIEQYEAENDAEIADVVGNKHGEMISKMAKTSGVLGRAESIALASINDPFTVDQTIALAIAFDEASSANPLHNRVAPGDIDPQTGLSEYDRGIIRQLRNTLSQSQLTAVQDHLSQARAASVARRQAHAEIERREKERSNNNNVITPK
jgi:hypothetical protein